jgi:hypothetical protein
MEEILIRLQKLENKTNDLKSELKKEREINRTLQLQIADMNEQIITLSETKVLESINVEKRVNNIERHLNSSEILDIKYCGFNQNQICVIQFISNGMHVSRYKDFVSYKADDRISSENRFYVYSTRKHTGEICSFAIPEKLFNKLNQLVIFMTSGRPSSCGNVQIYSVDIDNQQNYIICRVNKKSPLQIIDNYYFIGIVVNNDINNVISFFTNEKYTFNGFSYELVN